MMRLNLDTEGKPITVEYSQIHIHPELKIDMAHLEINVGGIYIDISFDNGEEMIAFCEKHNFDYNYKREEFNEQAVQNKTVEVVNN